MKIPIKVLTEIKAILNTGYLSTGTGLIVSGKDDCIEWHDNNGINTPYLVSWINKE